MNFLSPLVPSRVCVGIVFFVIAVATAAIVDVVVAGATVANAVVDSVFAACCCCYRCSCFAVQEQGAAVLGRRVQKSLPSVVHVPSLRTGEPCQPDPRPFVTSR